MFNEESRIEESILLELAYNYCKTTATITTKVTDNFGWHINPSQIVDALFALQAKGFIKAYTCSDNDGEFVELTPDPSKEKVDLWWKITETGRDYLLEPDEAQDDI